MYANLKLSTFQDDIVIKISCTWPPFTEKVLATLDGPDVVFGCLGSQSKQKYGFRFLCTELSNLTYYYRKHAQ